MRSQQSLGAMLALAAAISLPVVVAAQPATAPAPGTAPVRTAPPAATAAPSASSTYLTTDKRVRSSKIVGASVYNEQNEKIGTIDDVLISPGKEASAVVLSVGGFLGIASKLVEVPYAQLTVANDRLVIPGTSKDQLGHMPDYKYAPG